MKKITLIIAFLLISSCSNSTIELSEIHDTSISKQCGCSECDICKVLCLCYECECPHEYKPFTQILNYDIGIDKDGNIIYDSIIYEKACPCHFK